MRAKDRQQAAAIPATLCLVGQAGQRYRAQKLEAYSGLRAAIRSAEEVEPEPRSEEEEEKEEVEGKGNTKKMKGKLEWVKLFDEASGLHYYQNIAGSGTTQWEVPTGGFAEGDGLVGATLTREFDGGLVARGRVASFSVNADSGGSYRVVYGDGALQEDLTLTHLLICGVEL